MASFAGIDLGPYVHMQTEANPHQIQTNAYPGIDGLELLTLGSRGGTTHCQGACTGSDPTALAVAEQTFRAHADAATCDTLIDTLGTSWSNVILVRFTPIGPVYPIAGLGYIRNYVMEFLHAR